MKTRKLFVLSIIILVGMVSCKEDPDIPKDVIFYSHSVEDSIYVHEGAIKGVFSVSDTEQVCFSKGNLQYQASTNTWRFAEHQWDYVGTQTPDGNGHFGGTVEGSDNVNILDTYDGWIDLFGWGTSGWNNGNSFYHPYNFQHIDNLGQGYGYGPTDGTNYQFDLTGVYANSDWGVFNPISNGENTLNIWRTLSNEEWNYVFNDRNTISGIRYAKAQINGINGVILLPDNWNTFYFELNYSSMHYTSNIISVTQWAILEKQGAVFLPAAGCRIELSVKEVNLYGRYWSSSSFNSYSSYSVYFTQTSSQISQNRDFRNAGYSVRLVCPIK